MPAPLSPLAVVSVVVVVVVVVAVVSFIEMSIAFEMLKNFRLPRSIPLPLLLGRCCLRRVPKCHSGNKKSKKQSCFIKNE